MAQGMPNMPNLKAFGLGWHQLGGEGTKAIAQGMPHIPTARTLAGCVCVFSVVSILVVFVNVCSVVCSCVCSIVCSVLFVFVYLFFFIDCCCYVC